MRNAIHRALIRQSLHGVLAAALAVSACLLAGGPASATSGTADLYAGQELTGGQSLVNGSMAFVMGTDGNLVLTNNGYSVWANGKTGHSGAYLIMQKDGNLVEYSGSNAVWSSGTANHPGSYLALSANGEPGVYLGAALEWGTPRPNTRFSDGQYIPDVLFAGQTRDNFNPYLDDVTGTYTLVENSGTLTEFRGNTALWSVGQVCSLYNYAIMQADGNLVIYCNGSPVWTSGTGGHSPSNGYYLHLQADGNLVIYSNWGVAEWSNGA